MPDKTNVQSRKAVIEFSINHGRNFHFIYYVARYLLVLNVGVITYTCKYAIARMSASAKNFDGQQARDDDDSEFLMTATMTSTFRSSFKLLHDPLKKQCPLMIQ
jgi:hypothetical protein